MDFFQKLFASMGSEDSIAFLFFILCAFLLGFLIAALGWGARARRRKKELEQLNKNYEDLQIENERLQEQIDLKQADLIRAEREAQEASSRSRVIEKEKEALDFEIATLTNENAELQTLTQTYANNIEALNNQIIGLNTRNNQLSVNVEKEGEAMNQFMDMQSSHNVTVSRLTALESKLEAVSNENDDLRKTLSDVKSTEDTTSFSELEAKINQLSKENEDLYKSLENVESKTSLTDLETKINAVLGENAAILEELNGMKSNTGILAFASTPNDKNISVGDTEVATATAEENTKINKKRSTELAKSAIKNAIGHKIEAATKKQKDDLTVIKGIGNFIEQKLNAVGLFTYKQISQLDEETIEQVTTAIEFFPGRIKRDDWVGQAARLLDIKKENPTILKKSIYPDNVEDLKIIEGVGPKIEKLLKTAGIQTWEELAKADVADLKTILLEAGDRYRIHDPSTWPMQAQMAADWKWTELKDYQDYLVGGRDTK